MRTGNLLTAIVLISGMIMSLSAQPAFKFSGIGGQILAQNGSGTEDETIGTTPRIKSKKKYEYKEGKSPMIAAGLSLLLPGAGEFYGRDYIRSGIFFGIEATMLSMWYYYESDGDDRKAEYRDYADTNFDENLYYGGLLGMTSNLKSWYEMHNGDVITYDNDSTYTIDASVVWSYEYFSDRDNWTHDDDQYNIDGSPNDSLGVVDFLDLSFKSPWNTSVVSLEGGSAQFTHNLPETKTQQYYEMVGKYHQFACGWNDFNGYEYDEDGKIIMVTDSVKAADGSYKYVMIPKFKDTNGDGVSDNDDVFDYSDNGFDSESHVDFYEDLRDETNKAYETGSNFLMVTLLNHVASAFDASYVIKKNYQIDTQIRVENNDKAQRLSTDNYKITYSIAW